MQKFEYVTIAAGILLVTLLFILFGFYGITSIAGVAVCTGLSFVIITIHLQNKGFRIPVVVCMLRICIMSIITIVFFISIVFIGLNIPKEPYFTDTLQVGSPEVLTPPRYTQFMNLLSSSELPQLSLAQLQAISELDYSKENIVQYLTQTASFRESLFSYVSITPIELPGAQRALIETQTAEYSVLITAVKAEATEIRWFYAIGRAKEATKKYIRLWKSIEMMCRGKNSIIHTVYTIAMTDIALNALENDRFPISLSKSEILSSLRYVRAMLPQAFHDSLVLEYEMLSRVLRDIPHHIPYFVPEGLPMLYAFNTEILTLWPFYDINKTRRVLHEYYTYLTELNKLPYYQAESELLRLNDVYRMNVLSRKAVNSTGKAFLARIGIEYNTIFLQKDALLGRLAVVDAVLSAKTFDEESLPADLLTGNKYRVRYSRDMIAVISTYPETNKERIVFAWEK